MCDHTYKHTSMTSLQLCERRSVYVFCSLVQVFAENSLPLPRTRGKLQRPIRRRRLLSNKVTHADQELLYGSAVPHFAHHRGLISSVQSFPYSPVPTSAPLVICGNYNHNNSLHHHQCGGKSPTTRGSAPCTECEAETHNDEDTGSPER